MAKPDIKPTANLTMESLLSRLNQTVGGFSEEVKTRLEMINEQAGLETQIAEVARQIPGQTGVEISAKANQIDQMAQRLAEIQKLLGEIEPQERQRLTNMLATGIPGLLERINGPVAERKGSEQPCDLLQTVTDVVNITKVPEPMREPLRDVEVKRSNRVSGWTEIVGDRVNDTAFMKQTTNSLRRLIMSNEAFQEFGGEGQRMDYLGMLGQMGDLTVGEINKAFDPNNGHNLKMVEKIIGLAEAVKNGGEYREIEELNTIVSEIRGAGTSDGEMKVFELIPEREEKATAGCGDNVETSIFSEKPNKPSKFPNTPSELEDWARWAVADLGEQKEMQNVKPTDGVYGKSDLQKLYGYDSEKIEGLLDLGYHQIIRHQHNRRKTEHTFNELNLLRLRLLEVYSNCLPAKPKVAEMLSAVNEELLAKVKQDKRTDSEV